MANKEYSAYSRLDRHIDISNIWLTPQPQGDASWQYTLAHAHTRTLAVVTYSTWASCPACVHRPRAVGGVAPCLGAPSFCVPLRDAPLHSLYCDPSYLRILSFPHTVDGPWWLDVVVQGPGPGARVSTPVIGDSTPVVPTGRGVG